MSTTAFTRRAVVTAVALLALVVTPFALGAKGGKPAAPTPSVSVSPGGAYTFGEAVYVTTNVPAYPDNMGPWIEMKCSQNGVVVGTSDEAGFPGAVGYQTPFYLGPSATWTSGAADCAVTVFHLNNSKMVTDATTSFHVDG
ncbi:MAG TPA: hypothetical protein VFM57_15375 [Thermoleophilaceae bacterium]|nr:hypothetical protein [Thermoleophilaceae bacterium]